MTKGKEGSFITIVCREAARNKDLTYHLNSLCNNYMQRHSITNRTTLPTKRQGMLDA